MKVIGDFASGPVDPRFDGAKWDFEPRGDFAVSEVLFVKLPERLGIIGPHSSECQFNLFDQLTIVEATVGRRRHVVGHCRAIDQRKPAFREQRPATIRRDGEHPGLESPRIVPTCQAVNRADKCFLGNVFGLVPIAQHTPSESEHAVLKLIDQFDDAIGVAG